jgi:hypothetical protein
MNKAININGLSRLLNSNCRFQVEGTGHRKSDWAFAIDDGEVVVAGQDLQRCLRVAPVVAEEVGLGFEDGGFACRLMAGSSERSAAASFWRMTSLTGFWNGKNHDANVSFSKGLIVCDPSGVDEVIWHS